MGKKSGTMICNHSFLSFFLPSFLPYFLPFFPASFLTSLAFPSIPSLPSLSFFFDAYHLFWSLTFDAYPHGVLLGCFQATAHSTTCHPNQTPPAGWDPSVSSGICNNVNDITPILGLIFVYAIISIWFEALRGKFWWSMIHHSTIGKKHIKTVSFCNLWPCDDVSVSEVPSNKDSATKAALESPLWRWYGKWHNNPSTGPPVTSINLPKREELSFRTCDDIGNASSWLKVLNKWLPNIPWFTTLRLT